MVKSIVILFLAVTVLRLLMIVNTEPTHGVAEATPIDTVHPEPRLTHQSARDVIRYLEVHGVTCR